MDWQVIVTLVIAIITAYVAYLSYRTRSTLLVTKEKHSEDLKDILRRWASKLADLDLVIFLENTGGETQFPLAVEQELLFSDVGEHMPDGFNLPVQWEVFKADCRRYDTGRHELFERIHSDACKANSTALTQTPITSSYALCIYVDSARLGRGDTQEWLNEDFEIKPIQRANSRWFQLYVGTIWVAEGGDEKEIVRAREHLRMVLENLFKDEIVESGYVAEAKRLHDLECVLRQRQNNLLEQVNELLAIPILPNDCKHIKRAFPPLFPSRSWFSRTFRRSTASRESPDLKKRSDITPEEEVE